MTSQEIKTFVESLVDDSLDETYFLNVLNGAKDAIEGERDWEFLKKVDSSKTWATTDDYTTAHALQTDFVEPVALYVGSEYEPYIPVPFEMRQYFKDSPKRYYIDYQSKNLYLCGSTSEAKTLYLCYIYQTDDLTLTTSPVWPARFHKLLAYYVAGIHMGAVDSDDIARILAPNQKVEYLLIRKNMVDHDARCKAHSLNYSSTPERLDVEHIPDVVY